MLKKVIYSGKVRVVVFLLLLIGIVYKVSDFVLPVWPEWNNFDTTQGFYERPKDSLEAIFLGTSAAINGFSPMEIYKEYGINSYNLATEQQPPSMSYYWLKEAYRKNPNSLKTVIFDPSNLRKGQTEAAYRKAIDTMQFSGVKLEAIKECSEDTDEMLSYLFPIIYYHDGWKDIGETNFTKNKMEPETFTAGYNIVSKIKMTEGNIDQVYLPMYQDISEVQAGKFDEKRMEYFSKIVSFCREKNLNLIIVKTPMSAWNATYMKTMEAVAEQYDIPLYDYNQPELLEQMEFSYATDMMDGHHLNYYGAKKLSGEVGRLLQETGCQDIRGSKEYSYLETYLKQYEEKVASSLIVDPIEYISSFMTEDECVFITVMDDGGAALTEEQRNAFEKLGLSELSSLEYRNSYLAVIDDGVLVYEQKSAEKNPIETSGKLGKITYSLQSGGLKSGNCSSCIINGEEFSPMQRGLNVVIYSKVEQKVIAAKAFDTDTINNFRLYDENLEARYNQRVKNYKILNQVLIPDRNSNSPAEYIRDASKDYVVITVVMDEASRKLDDQDKEIFSELGLSELAELGYRESYISIIDSGTVLFEQRDNGKEPITYTDVVFDVVSAGFKAGNIASICIEGEECITAGRGLNVVVYDKNLKCVVDSWTFDTHMLKTGNQQ